MRKEITLYIQDLISKLIINSCSSIQLDAFARTFSSELPDVSREDWQAFCHALAGNTSLRQLELSHCNLWKLGADRWSLFCEALARHPKLKKLDLSFNKLNELDEVRLDIFFKALAKNQSIEHLALYQNSLDCLEKGWGEFCNAFQHMRSLEVLNISSDSLVKMKEESWKKFLHALEANQSICFVKEYDLHQEYRDQYKKICVQHRRLKEDILFTTIHCLMVKMGREDSAALKILEFLGKSDSYNFYVNLAPLSSRIDSHLDSVKSYKLNAEPRLDPLLEKMSMNDPEVTEINFFMTEFFRIDHNRWERFCTALSQTKTVTKLNLFGNYLGTLLGKERWRMFFQVLQTNQSLRVLNLARNRMEYMCKELVDEFINTLKLNKSLFEISAILLATKDNFEINSIVKRNKQCFRHENALALGHCLRSMALPKNVVTQLPKGVAMNILTYFDDSLPLARQIIIEVDEHIERVKPK